MIKPHMACALMAVMLTESFGCVFRMGWVSDREIPRGGLVDVVHVERISVLGFCRAPPFEARQ